MPKYLDQLTAGKRQGRNKFAGHCYKCGDVVQAGQGYYEGSTVKRVQNANGEWRDSHRSLVICDFCLATAIHDEELRWARQQMIA